MAAAARKSSMREFVHEPIKTLLMEMSVILVPAVKPMYFNAAAHESRSTGIGKIFG